MSTETLLALVTIIMVGTYFQTVTGFGLGIIVIGGSSALDLATVAVMAAVVSLVTVVNCAVALPGATKQIDWRAIGAVAIGAIPGIITGVLLLELLSASATSILQGLLGIMVVYSGLSFLISPTKKTERTGDTSFFVSGFSSGLTGGLFGMGGPPLVYQLYRQPFDIKKIRNMLLVIFACTSVFRSVFIGIQGQLNADILLLTAFALPAVTLMTFVGRRFPPPLSADAMRRVVFSVLMLIGISLMTSAYIALFM